MSYIIYLFLLFTLFDIFVFGENYDHQQVHNIIISETYIFSNNRPFVSNTYNWGIYIYLNNSMSAVEIYMGECIF